MDVQEIFDKTIDKVKSEMDKFKGEMPSKAELTAINAEIEKVKAENLALKAESEASKANIEKIKGLEDSFVKLNAKLEKTEAEETKSKSLFEALKSAFTKEKIANVAKGISKAEREVLTEKDYSISSGRTGSVMITAVRDRIVSEFGRRKIHMRDILGLQPIESTTYVYDKVTAVTEYSTVNSENGDLIQSSFTTAEQNDTGVRLGNFDFISKNAIKMANWAVQRYATLFEKMILMKEDFLLLYGQGSSNELNGLKNEATAVTLVGKTFSAGEVASVATYNAGTQAKVTFGAAHGLKNGQNITFANATATGYNTSFAVNVWNETVIILDVTYVAEADTSAWTASVFENMYHKVDNAGTADAVIAAVTFMQTRDSEVNAILMNPTDVALIFTDKTTTGEPTSMAYGIAIERRGMDVFVGGVPVIEMNAVKAGDVFVGEWSLDNVEFFAFEPISLDYTEDTTTKKSNKVMISAEEQVLFAIYNPFAFGYANIATLKTQLEKP